MTMTPTNKPVNNKLSIDLRENSCGKYFFVSSLSVAIHVMIAFDPYSIANVNINVSITNRSSQSNAEDKPSTVSMNAAPASQN